MNRNTDSGIELHHHERPDAGHRNLLKLTGAGVAAVSTASFLKTPNAKAQDMSQEWDKVFPKRRSTTGRSRSGTATASRETRICRRP